MRLRKLMEKDAPLMLEWMHDRGVTQNLRADFSSRTLEDARRFIDHSQEDDKNLHLAVVSDRDEYMGTVSLKDLSPRDGSAEFAIVVRSCAMGRGYAWFAMQEILRIAFCEQGLKRVYWCVSRENQRAVRFYEKHGFSVTSDPPERLLQQYCKSGDLAWYFAEGC